MAKKPGKPKAKAEKGKGGRPKKFGSVEELEALIDQYFSDCEAIDKPFTVTGLALALDTTRETLMDYQKDPVFSDAIKRAKTRVENYAEERLFTSSPTGPIFALKNFGWKDKPEPVDHDDDVQPVKVEITVKDARKPDAVAE